MNKPDCQSIEDAQDIIDTPSLYNWLQLKAKQYQLQYLLAHADDGVIWGRFESDGTLLTQTKPEDLFQKYKLPTLQWSTLQQCRMFSKNNEVMVWKANQRPKARVVTELEKTEYICEPQILWGTNGIKRDNFTLLWDGSQGLRHAVPFTDIDLKGDRLVNPVRLLVHHYIDYDDSGVARIYLSRLVDLRGT